MGFARNGKKVLAAFNGSPIDGAGYDGLVVYRTGGPTPPPQNYFNFRAGRNSNYYGYVKDEIGYLLDPELTIDKIKEGDAYLTLGLFKIATASG